MCCSDEFFLLANKPIPDAKYYGNFCQLDDGVGSLRLIMDDFDTIELPKTINKKTTICIACSLAAERAFKYISEKLNKIKNLSLRKQF